MRIEGSQLQHWVDNFYGYGSWEARFWFVGNEESGGDFPEETAEKFHYFSQTHSESKPTLVDIRAMYKNVGLYMNGPKASLYNSIYEYRFGENAVQHGVWKNLIAFVHGYQKKKVLDPLDYQRAKIGAPSAKSEALISLYPLPTHSHAWYYAWLDLPQSGFLRTRAMFQAHVYQRRITTILQNIATYTPEVVLMYSMDNINDLKDSIRQVFPDAEFKMIKAIKHERPQYHRAKVNGTILLLTTQIPALKHNRIETGFDWELLGKTIKEEMP